MAFLRTERLSLHLTSRYADRVVNIERIGNYSIVAERGRDATGCVFEARHLVLPRRAIVKVMDGSEPRYLAIQLLREACILEALEHPGVVRVFEAGLLAERRPWFAQEHVEGESVEELLAKGALAPLRAVELVRDIADVLEHAHRRGIVHCGLRPEGIVVTGRSRGFSLCIVDWSDARTHDTASRGALPALREYVAPELVAGAAIDDRMDVFSLGVIAYQALTGALPFDGVTAAKTADGVAHHVPTEVRCPEAPPELTTLVDQMLSTAPWDRPSTAEVHAELVQLALDLAEPPPVSASGAGIVRIRKPRWTPSMPMPDIDTGPILFDLADDAPEKSS
jgi:serine/threonine-protein kinase